MASPQETGEFLGYVGNVACYRCKLRGNGITDTNSNWRLWNADMKVYRAAKPPRSLVSADDGGSDEVFASKDEELLTRMDRARKAIMWFTVAENLREEHLLDMGGTDKTAEDVMRRLWERVAPPGTPYQPLEKVQITDKMREDMRRFEERRAARDQEMREEEAAQDEAHAKVATTIAATAAALPEARPAMKSSGGSNKKSKNKKKKKSKK
ncbi:hypothetical protein GGS23DRAFT_49039 [Durotheca rogersii]|uniref:uncharacterized protein n=1 Tax=Durotheca rogersii TaxID=419775 RepID=UPI00221EA05A|nr:uncharacterized protein GGS23DRAFT_49039 [Durotheca rogersii]KAI5863025.1 hypothetical protein GGS23DRAFT_49039 [Durotheca rogersii]